MIEEYDMES